MTLFEKYVQDVNQLFMDKVGITTEDVGLETSDLAGLFSDDESPSEVVDYHIEKFDLTLREEYMLEPLTS